MGASITGISFHLCRLRDGRLMLGVVSSTLRAFGFMLFPREF